MTGKFFTLALAAQLAACSPGQTDDATGQSPFPPADIVATEAQNNGTLNMRIGQTLEVRLHGNETIDPPRVWNIVSTASNLERNGDRLVSDDPTADGAGATWIFRFTAVGRGRGLLIFGGGASGPQVRFVIMVSD